MKKAMEKIKAREDEIKEKEEVLQRLKDELAQQRELAESMHR